MSSLGKSFKKLFRIAIIWLLGLIIAGLEIKYPLIFGYQLINSGTIGALLFVAHDGLKHNGIVKK